MASGRIFATDLTAGAYNSAYQVPVGKTTTCSVSICNRNTTSVMIRLALAASTGTPANGEFIEYSTMIPGFGVLERTGLILAATQYITVYSDTANVSAVGYGFEE